MAKPLANGFPIGAIMVKDKVAGHITPGKSQLDSLQISIVLRLGVQDRMAQHSGAPYLPLAWHIMSSAVFPLRPSQPISTLCQHI